MERVSIERIRLELGRLNLRLHPSSRYRVADLAELSDMMLEDIGPYSVSDGEFQSVIRWWRVKNNFVPTSKDVLEALAVVREDARIKAQLALPAGEERKEDVFSKEYCEHALGKIRSILQSVNKTSPSKHMEREHGRRM